MDFVELKCKSCGGPIRNEDIDWHFAMARCPHCGSVFSLRGIPGMESKIESFYAERPEVSMPKGIEVVNTEGGLEISRRWFGPKFLFMILFTVCWDGFMLVWHGIALSTGQWFMSAFGILHTAVGIGLAYYSLAGILNITFVSVKMGELKIQHYPLPWPGNKSVLAADIDQIYCKEKISRSDSGNNTSYEVHAIMKNKAKAKLLEGLDQEEQVLYIEQELERYLGCMDRPVRGEIPR